jgi:hypothetical protein
MYKMEVNIGEYDFLENEVVIIESYDFDKLAIIAEFIEFQKEYGWAVDYDVTEEFEDAQCDEEDEYEDEEEEYEDEEEDEESEEYEIGEIVEDENGLLWKRVA